MFVRGVYRSSKWCHHFVRNSVLKFQWRTHETKTRALQCWRRQLSQQLFASMKKKCLLKKKSFLVSLWDLFGMVICDPFKGWKGDLQPLGIKSRSGLWITTCEWRFLLNRECSWVIFRTKIWVWHQDQRVAKTSGPRWTKTYAFGKLDQI